VMRRVGMMGVMGVSEGERGGDEDESMEDG
jgi:hypothetical protein